MLEVINFVCVLVKIVKHRVVHVRADICEFSACRVRGEHCVGKHEYVGKVVTFAIERAVIRLTVRIPVYGNDNILMFGVERVDIVAVVYLFRSLVSAPEFDLNEVVVF